MMNLGVLASWFGRSLQFGTSGASEKHDNVMVPSIVPYLVSVWFRLSHRSHWYQCVHVHNPFDRSVGAITVLY